MNAAESTADVLVVGAGSSGAVVAGRLVEHGLSVLLLEAGPDWRSESCPRELRHPRPDIFAWKVGGATPEHFTWPNVRASRRPGRPAEPYLRGRGLGGTSSINGLVVIRPPVEEWSDWVEAGCSGWSAEDVLPAFVRSENDLDYGDLPYHGRGGPTPIVRREDASWGAADHLLYRAARAAGHKWVPDHNAPGAFGISRTASNIRMGVRVTTNDGYLEPYRSNSRLRIIADTLVDKVIFDDTEAVGVRALVHGDWLNLHAGKVVLCAGSVASPAILQRSGIGPADLLRSLGITPVADLPVGMEIQDHVGFWLSARLEGDTVPGLDARGNVTLRYTSGTPGSGAGDILMVSANPLISEPDTVAVGVKLAQCHSRGSLRIGSSDPQEAPDIQMNLLTDERDRVLGRRAARDALHMLAEAGTTAVRDRHGEVIHADINGAALDSWLDRVATDTSHLSCSTRMGHPDARTTVVDPQAKVLGISNLYVADMSIAPMVPRANTHLTAVMIGERVSEFVAASS